MEGPATNRRGDTGTLWVVSTPIGNLEDITVRALKVLESADLIAAENTAHTRALCAHYGIKGRITPYHQHNQARKTSQLIARLKGGDHVALVTDAGTPGISDPGGILVSRAAAEGLRVSPVPGPSAATAALSVSGLPSDQFVFVGFLSNKAGRRKRQLQELAGESRTLVLFEAPHRIRSMLADLHEVMGERTVVLVREMTKLYEEVIRGTAHTILDRLPEGRVRGEITLVVEGKPAVTRRDALAEDLLEKIDVLLNLGEESVKGIAERLALEEGLAYRKVYKAVLSRLRNGRGSSEA
ncbi:MAG: 16S rRNA (cytidine(1402)-2'-O)-methyltransferase [Deltaproteobacteria bacterium]|nr:16S rRNA (cytidine(1402)-2'-O)-methyltransferase [Deltaproteobacteria bacterium]MBW1924449.1 16S rRNA (cytidine(1402)-2'-O)-methyltransferase [Deltaproteobacteria bacterium]MBW2103062.1 16S rRNA (cytidine(1402)-2'-O)-methyltransferase [Deltaproteobacteria bacterium]